MGNGCSGVTLIQTVHSIRYGRRASSRPAHLPTACSYKPKLPEPPPVSDSSQSHTQLSGPVFRCHPSVPHSADPIHSEKCSVGFTSDVCCLHEADFAGGPVCLTLFPARLTALLAVSDVSLLTSVLNTEARVPQTFHHVMPRPC